MSNLAIFVFYSRDGKVCPNAMLYAEELTKFFDEVIISSNIKIKVKNKKIKCLQFDKNGYDIGYFVQAIEKLNAYDKYNVIGFFNDSNYIINSLDIVLNWCLTNDLDFCGITDSDGGRPDINVKDQYHIQSHFLIFKNKAIKALKIYLELCNIEKHIFSETNLFKKRKNTIIFYEIMLSVFMRRKNISMGSYYVAKNFIPKVSKCPPQVNINTVLWKELIENNYPFIKRKLVNRSFNDMDYNELMKMPGMTSMYEAMNVVNQLGNKEYINTITYEPIR